VPAIVASSDDGIGGGIQVDVYDHHGGQKPFHAWYELVVLATSRKEQTYSFFMDRPGLFGGDYRLIIDGGYNRTPRAQYYGIGNDTERDRDLEDARFYEYDRGDLGGKATLRRKLGHGFQAVGLFYAHRFFVKAPPGNFLAQDNPTGVHGGFIGMFGVGLARDTRDNESWPTRGGFDEISARIAPGPAAFAPFGGVGLYVRRYYKLTPKLIFAARGAIDFMGGDPAFFSMENLGLSTEAAVGGSSTLRGLPRSRLLGKAKMLLAGELRFLPFEIHPFHANVRIGGAAFVDTGRVLGNYDEPIFGPDHKGLDLSIGEGLGFRIVYENDFVIRIDFGHSSEDLARSYLDTGHPF
jgi:outer membrane protein assembly factor BamA